MKPGQVTAEARPDGTVRLYRWVPHADYRYLEGRIEASEHTEHGPSSWRQAHYIPPEALQLLADIVEDPRAHHLPVEGSPEPARPKLEVAWKGMEVNAGLIMGMEDNDNQAGLLSVQALLLLAILEAVQR
jgi:hypothetical protein